MWKTSGAAGGGLPSCSVAALSTTIPGDFCKTADNILALYVGPIGGRYLVTTIKQITPTRAWGCSGVNVGASSTSNGILNTNIIASHACATATHPARECRNIGHGDWYLPARDELVVMHSSLQNLNVTPVTYWSSTEWDSMHVWRVPMGMPLDLNGASKTASMEVRCFKSY